MKHVIATLLLLPTLAFGWLPPAGKPVTATVGFAPGSPNEISFRIAAAQVEKNNSDIKFVVNSRPGANESVGINWFAQQPASGANLYIASQQGLFTATEIWYPGQLKISPMDMEFVTTIAKSPLAVVANINSRVNTPEQLLERMKNTQQPVNFAVGALSHKLLFEYLMDKTKSNNKLIQSVMYQGPLQAVTDVANNQAEFGIMPAPTAYPLVKAGKVKFIALAGEKPLSQLPAVPLWKDYVPGMNFYAAWMIMLPPGTPREQVDYYNRLFVPAINSPQAQHTFNENLMFTVSAEQTPEGARAYMSRLIRHWAPYVKKIPVSQ